MISLQDKIHKFEKLIYNKQLDDFIPIDQQFISGGITMQSLIQQNAFIVEEIKKIKNVFVNYCKLNQTVYQKITEHQLALHSQTSKLQNLSNSVQRKMTDAVKQVKSMYQEMKYESVRTKNLVDQAVRPISQAISKKVDQSSFTMQIKRIMAQLDQDPQQILGEHSINGQQTGQSFSTDQLAIRKRKGKNVSNQQYQAQKAKNTKLFIQLSQKIQQLQIKNRQYDPIIYKNTSTINKLTQLTDVHQTQIFKINRDIKQVRNFISNTEQRLLTEINNKTSDNVWEAKLNAFQNKNVSPRFQYLTKEINKNQKLNNQHFADLQPKFNKINLQIINLHNLSENNTNQIQNISASLQQISHKLTQEITVMEQKLNVVYNQKKVKIQKIHQKIDSQIAQRTKQIQNLNTVIKDLSKTIEDKVLIGVRKNLDVKIHQIDKNIHSLTNKQKSLQEQINISKGEIYNIKQVLSKKANFTDILMHFERKADKQDFKQLKDKIQTTTPSHLKSTILDSPQRTRRTISASSRKRSSLSRNLINPITVLNDDKQSLDSQNDRSSRLFIMGLQSQMGLGNDRRRMSYTQSTRRKKMRSNNVGMLNLLANN